MDTVTPSVVVEQVGKTQALIQDGPLSFVAAVFAMASVVLFWLYVRSKDAHRIDAAKTNEAHAMAIAELNTAMTQRVVRIELAIHGLLGLTDDIRALAVDARRRMVKQGVKETTNSGYKLTPEQLAQLKDGT